MEDSPDTHYIKHTHSHCCGIHSLAVCPVVCRGYMGGVVCASKQFNIADSNMCLTFVLKGNSLGHGWQWPCSVPLQCIQWLFKR